MPKNFIEKVNSKAAVIGIVGLGYVGLPLAIRCAEAGYHVLGFDIDADKVNNILAAKSYIKHILPEDLERVKPYLDATTEFSRIQEVDTIIMCVPTPLNKYREPDISYIINTIESALPYIKKGQLISLESTTYPGTTEEELLPRIESTGHKVGKDVYLVYSPEREDPGNVNFTTRTIPKVVSGITEACLEAGVALYGAFIDKIVPVSSTKAAEMSKLLENIHRSINIGLVNEMKIVADKMGIDIYEVIDAAATKPFGFTPYYPGPGLGGHCIPIDPFYLTWKAREFGVYTRFIELAGEINRDMPEWVFKKISLALNSHGKSVSGSKVLVIGLSYKKNIDDARHSPSFDIIETLLQHDALVDYHDTYLPTIPKMREHNLHMSSVDITPESIPTYDCIVIATDHDNIDYELLINSAKIVVDTRGRYRKRRKNLVRA